jgi:hypothetical protein
MTIVQWIVAAGTSVFVALIGYFQYRTARQKFALDLFERRYETYTIVRQAVAQVTSRGSLDLASETALSEAIEKAYFFFGDDVIQYLKGFQDDVIGVNSYAAELSEIADPDERGSMIEKNRAAKERIFKFYGHGESLFGKYMRFDESVPRHPFTFWTK